MAEPPVVDASPMILLAKIGRLDILRLAGETLVVPEPVAAEVRAYRDDAGARALDSTPWLRIVPAPPIPRALARCGLGSGEASVVAWALAHRGTEVILDDRVARRHCELLDLHVRGTVHLVLLARKRGILSAARPVMEQLRREGMYLSDSLLDGALRLVDE